MNRQKSSFFLSFINISSFLSERPLSGVERDRNDFKQLIKLYWPKIFLSSPLERSEKDRALTKNILTLKE